MVEPAAAIGQPLAQLARQGANVVLCATFTQQRQHHLAVVIGAGLEAMCEQRLERFGIGHRNVRTHVERWCNPQHFRQAEFFHALDRDPADIDFEFTQREFRRTRKCVMVVVQFFAANPQAPRGEVGRSVGGLVIAITPPVTDAIDHSGCPERHPQHLHGPDRHADHAEQRHADEQQDGRAQRRVFAVQVALDPVVRATLAVFLDRRGVGARLAIQLDAAPHHGVDALDLRAVRIFFGLALGVVLAMDRRPLLGHHRGGEPAPETEEVRECGMEIDRPMRLAAMQVQGDRKDGQLGNDQEIDADFDPAEAG